MGLGIGESVPLRRNGTKNLDKGCANGVEPGLLSVTHGPSW